MKRPCRTDTRERTRVSARMGSWGLLVWGVNRPAGRCRHAFAATGWQARYATVAAEWTIYLLRMRLVDPQTRDDSSDIGDLRAIGDCATDHKKHQHSHLRLVDLEDVTAELHRGDGHDLVQLAGHQQRQLQRRISWGRLQTEFVQRRPHRHEGERALCHALHSVSLVAFGLYLSMRLVNKGFSGRVPPPG